MYAALFEVALFSAALDLLYKLTKYNGNQDIYSSEDSD